MHVGRTCCLLTTACNPPTPPPHFFPLLLLLLLLLQRCAPTGLCSHGPLRPVTCTGRTDTFSTLSPVTSMPTTVTMTTRRAPSLTHAAGPCGTVSLCVCRCMCMWTHVSDKLFIHSELDWACTGANGIYQGSNFVFFLRTRPNGLCPGGRPAFARLPERSPPSGHCCGEHVTTATAEATGALPPTQERLS